MDKTTERAKGPITILDLTLEEDLQFLEDLLCKSNTIFVSYIWLLRAELDQQLVNESCHKTSQKDCVKLESRHLSR